MNSDEIVEFYLPFPPSVNNYYVKTNRGMFISMKGKKFRQQVQEAIYQQVPDCRLDEEEKLLVEVVLFAPDKRKRDVDNYNKSLLDAITKTQLWEDDSQIDQLFNYRGEVVKGGQVFVRISAGGPILKITDRLPED
jgi:crossover junction endodeoxyribonuclease RusA